VRFPEGTHDSGVAVASPDLERGGARTVETQKYYEIRAMNSDKATDLYTVFLHRQTH